MRRLLKRLLRAPEPHAATYADVVTGGLLWVAFRNITGRLALRETERGRLIELPAELRALDHGVVAASVDLTQVPELPTLEAWTHDVVVVGQRGRPRSVWAPQGKLPTMAVPVEGRQFRVRKGATGLLQVQHDLVPPHVAIRGFASRPGEVDLLLPEDTEGEVLLVEKGTILARFPLRRDGDHCRATLTADDIPAERFTVAEVGVGTPAEWLPARRSDNGLDGPGFAVPLPELFGEDPSLPLVRLRYARHGGLTVRVPEDANATVGRTG